MKPEVLFLDVIRHLTHFGSCPSGTNLVKKAIYAMVEGDCDEVRNTQGCGRTSCARLFTNMIININVDICLKNIKK